MPYADPEAQREYQRKWVAQRRADWIDANGPCVTCGSRDTLQVDHVESGLKVDHKVWSWSDRRREEELAKCQVLCLVCHKKKSVAERARGERNGQSVLTTHQVAEVRRRVAAGETMASLGREFGVGRGHVWALVHRTTRYYE